MINLQKKDWNRVPIKKATLFPLQLWSEIRSRRVKIKKKLLPLLKDKGYGYYSFSLLASNNCQVKTEDLVIGTEKRESLKLSA